MAQPGRPSLTAQRRDQILDGVVACILQYGLNGTTRSRVADQAGVSPSAVHHFVGTQDRVIAAAVTRALDRVNAVAVDAFADLPAPQRLDAQINVLFTDRLAAPQITQLVDELIAHSYRDPATQAAVGALYLRFQQLLTESINAAYPHAPQPTLTRSPTPCSPSPTPRRHSTPSGSTLSTPPKPDRPPTTSSGHWTGKDHTVTTGRS